MSRGFLRHLVNGLFLILLGAMVSHELSDELMQVLWIAYVTVFGVQMCVVNFLEDPKYHVMLYNGTDLVLTETGIRALDNTCVVSIARHVGGAKKFYKYRKFGLRIHPRIKTIYRAIIAHYELGVNISVESEVLVVKGLDGDPAEYDWVVKYCVNLLRDLYKIGTDKEDTRFLKRIRPSFHDRGYK